jgi:peptide/nickel transport system ATP-binding protein
MTQSVTQPFLEVKDLKVHFNTDDGVVRSVDGLTFGLERGRTLGIVGESGSGKSVTSLGIMGIYNKRNADVTGEIWLDGQELVNASPESVRKLRGNKLAMIFQDPLSAMHPYYSVGKQIIEAYQVHHNVSNQVARKHAVDMLGRVGIPQPERRVDDYPHQFSGGMRQRAMIAMALVNDPKLLIADEPTTALDVTVQAQILELMERLQEEFSTALVFITHDLGVVAEVADHIAVMYAGQIIEHADTRTLFAAPEHPYTWGLLRSIPRLDTPHDEELVPVAGRPPSLIHRPSGCRFHPRCPYVRDRHRHEVPTLEPSATGHEVACLLPAETRKRLWKRLAAGTAPEEARRAELAEGVS